MVSSAAMTTISISTQIPEVISNLMGTIAGVFNPQMTNCLCERGQKAAFGNYFQRRPHYDFYHQHSHRFSDCVRQKLFVLWVGRTQNARELYILAMLNVGTLFVSASIQVLYHVFLITKRVKLNSLVIVGSGALTVATVFVLLETTELGMYAIVGVSMVYGILRNPDFIAPVRGALSAGEMVYLLRRYFYGTGVHRADLSGGAAL